LLLLSIPFAFAVERLLIGTPHIYKQISYFTLFFLVTFAILYMVNPAFKLAATPIIIFLAFAIILLSGLVIFIMFRKLEVEMKKLKGLSASAHSADVSRVSTMMAAVQMGISTMRRRPIRTILTAATVTLLTFTILTFASFGSTWGNRKTYRGALTPPPRIMVRHPFWTPIPPAVEKTLSGYLTDKAVVVPRIWIAPLAPDVAESISNGESLDMLLATADAARVARVSAALALHPADIENQEMLRDRGFIAGARLDLLAGDGIFLTRTIADELGLSADDIGKTSLLFRGRSLVFGGYISEEMSAMKMLDGSSVLPVDYAASVSGEEVAVIQTAEQQSTMESDAMQFITFSLDSVVIIGSENARRLGGEIRAIVIYARDVADLDAIAADVSLISGFPTFLGSRGGVYRLFYSTLVEASGFRDLIIPIVLGGLIIFATMLGSVSDREREIYTFSSLGLAPAHVAGLFFAEASVYAVVGGMGGYLLGQIVAKVTGIMAEQGWVAVPTMNFSSTNAIATIFIVMCTVLLSTIYPAVKASRSANPGIQRQWKIGDPKGDVYDVKFPFTVSGYDLTGIVSFLEEHFNNYRDAAVGVFTTIHCEVIRQADGDMLGLKALVALSPFDLGIEQTLIMLSQPSDVEGIDEVRIIMRRESGAYNDWRRANRVFVNDLRKQFLIWRSLDTEVTEKYREMTLSRWHDIPVLDKEAIVEGLHTAAASHGETV
ncbi:MAG TPA: ABC transporter permease, partial [Sedimentisphaerales bacterium]|nr:ABC transporter permease [Sedimentisphaerales bacterium]